MLSLSTDHRQKETIMNWPLALTLVRHGESEANVCFQELSRRADPALEEAFRNTGSADYRLTPRGVEQAQAAGAWLKRNGFGMFGAAFVSQHMRTLETAGHLELDGIEWQLNDCLHERDSGHATGLPPDETARRYPEHRRHGALSTYHGQPPAGESLAAVAVRLHAGFIPVLRALPGTDHALSVSHGRTIRVLRAILEGQPIWTFDARERENHPDQQVWNAQIDQYTRVDPMDAAHVLPQFGWKRSVCPWDETKTDMAWKRIERRTYTNRDLIEVAERIERLFV